MLLIVFFSLLSRLVTFCLFLFSTFLAPTKCKGGWPSISVKRLPLKMYCIYMLWSYYLAKIGQLRCYHLGQVFFLEVVCIKNTINIGFRHISKRGAVAQSNCRRYSLGQGFPFLFCTKLGPDKNTYLAQIITPQNGHFFSDFRFIKGAEIPKISSFLNRQNYNFAR